MNYSRNREVIILKNLKSDFIEEAIIVLKIDRDYKKEKSKVLEEAQKIVTDYTKRYYAILSSSASKKSKKEYILPLFGGMIITTLIIFALVILFKIF